MKKSYAEIDDYYIEASVAIDKKDLKRLQQIVEKCPECVQHDEQGETLLHDAAATGTPEIIEFLYQSGGDINKIHRNVPPISKAVMFNQIDNVKTFLKLGAKLDNEDSVANPLFDAVLKNNTEIAKLLIDAGIDLTIQYSTRDDDWWDALSFARYHRCNEIAQMILDKLEKDGIDYDSIEPLTEDDFEEDEEEERISLGKYYWEHLGKIVKMYDDVGMQEKIYGGIRLNSRVIPSIYVIMPDKDRDYITLITVDMSEEPMAKTTDGLKYAEVMMKLPPDWDVSKEALSDMSKNWPFRMLLKTAHLAHQFEGTYIDETTVIPSGNPNDPILYFDGDTELSSVMLCRSEDIPPLKLSAKTTIDFFTLIPITKGEEELVHKIGSEAVKKQLPKGEMVDMEREYLA